MRKIILALYILFLPFQLKIPQIPLINTTNLFLIILFLLFIFTKNPLKTRLKFELPLLLFLIFWTFSFLHTVFSPRLIWTFEVATVFKRLISLVLGYFVFSKCIKNKKELKFITQVFLLSIVLVGISTIRGGTLAGINFADFKRSSGPFGEDWVAADIAGGFLAIFIPFLLSALFFARKMFSRLLSFIGLVISGTGLLTTYSRGSIVALLFSFVISTLFILRHHRRLAFFPKVTIFTLIIAGLLSWKLWVPQTIMTRMEDTIVEDQFGNPVALDKSSQKRVDIWNAHLALLQTDPIMGIGFGQSKHMLGVDPHNAFLLIAVEMGILAFLVFLWFLWGVFYEANYLLKTEFMQVGLGFIGCLSAFILVNMFYANFFRDTVAGTFWIALGILSASKKYATK